MLSLGLGLGLSRQQAAFSPLQLSPELFLDPSDTSTLFQDAAGTTPVTSAGDPVGLALDKSQGLALGPDLFATGPQVNSPWVDNGNRNYTIDGSQASQASLFWSGLVEAGAVYYAAIRVNSVSGGVVRLGAGPNNTSTGAPDVLSSYLVAGANNIGLFAPAGVAADVDLIELRKVSGNHLTAPSDAARPTYQTSGGLHWLEFDGVDDELATAAALPFSAQVFNCTAFRLDAYNSSFPEVITSRGNSVATSQRHPILTLPQSSPNNVRVNYGDSGGGLGMGEAALGLGVVVSSYADGTDRTIEANGQSQIGHFLDSGIRKVVS